MGSRVRRWCCHISFESRPKSEGQQARVQGRGGGVRAWGEGVGRGRGARARAKARAKARAEIQAWPGVSAPAASAQGRLLRGRGRGHGPGRTEETERHDVVDASLRPVREVLLVLEDLAKEDRAGDDDDVAREDAAADEVAVLCDGPPGPSRTRTLASERAAGAGVARGGRTTGT